MSMMPVMPEYSQIARYVLFAKSFNRLEKLIAIERNVLVWIHLPKHASQITTGAIFQPIDRPILIAISLVISNATEP